MTFTRLLSRGSVCESALTHNQSVQPRVFVLVGHSIGESDSIAIQQSIELDKVELGRLIGGDGSHLVEHQAGLFVVSAGYRHIGAELGEVDGNCELSALGSNCGRGGDMLPDPIPCVPPVTRTFFPRRSCFKFSACRRRTAMATCRPTQRVRRTDGSRTGGHQIYLFIYLLAVLEA